MKVLTDKEIYDILQDIDEDSTVFDTARTLEFAVVEKMLEHSDDALLKLCEEAIEELQYASTCKANALADKALKQLKERLE